MDGGGRTFLARRSSLSELVYNNFASKQRVRGGGGGADGRTKRVNGERSQCRRRGGLANQASFPRIKLQATNHFYCG